MQTKKLKTHNLSDFDMNKRSTFLEGIYNYDLNML